MTLVLFGPRRMHEVLRSLGRASRQLQTAVHDIQNELDEATRLEEAPRFEGPRDGPNADGTVEGPVDGPVERSHRP